MILAVTGVWLILAVAPVSDQLSFGWNMEKGVRGIPTSANCTDSATTPADMTPTLRVHPLSSMLNADGLIYCFVLLTWGIFQTRPPSCPSSLELYTFTMSLAHDTWSGGVQIDLINGDGNWCRDAPCSCRLGRCFCVLAHLQRVLHLLGPRTIGWSVSGRDIEETSSQVQKRYVHVNSCRFSHGRMSPDYVQVYIPEPKNGHRSNKFRSLFRKETCDAWLSSMSILSLIFSNGRVIKVLVIRDHVLDRPRNRDLQVFPYVP